VRRLNDVGAAEGNVNTIELRDVRGPRAAIEDLPGRRRDERGNHGEVRTGVSVGREAFA
jgi:hypothetical protein